MWKECTTLFCTNSRITCVSLSSRPHHSPNLSLYNEATQTTINMFKKTELTTNKGFSSLSLRQWKARECVHALYLSLTEAKGIHHAYIHRQSLLNEESKKQKRFLQKKKKKKTPKIAALFCLAVPGAHAIPGVLPFLGCCYSWGAAIPGVTRECQGGESCPPGPGHRHGAGAWLSLPSTSSSCSLNPKHYLTLKTK